MENLVKIENQQIVTDSRQIAEHFEKEHKSVLRSINEILAAQNCTANFFSKSTYENRGKQYPEYIMNRDGFSLLVMGFTGAKAMEWKIKYINAFNVMEDKLREQSTIQHISDRELQLEEKKLALEEKKFLYESWLKLSSLTDIPEYKQISQSYAANTLADKEVFALPQVTEKTYTATEVGEMLGISANKVGKLAKANNLKTDPYGKWFYDKSKYSGKQVESFRYNQAGVEAIRKKLNDSGNHGKIIGYEPYGGSDKLVALVQK